MLESSTFGVRTSTPKPDGKIHIEIPAEDWQRGDEDYVAALDLSLCGTLDAGQNWSLEVWHFWREVGFRKVIASTSNFRHVDHEINATVHGDDFLATADDENLWWMMQEVHKKFETKTSVLEATFLKRTLVWSAEGIRYEPDPKHASIIMEETVTENSKVVSTPMSHADLKELASVIQDNGEIHEDEYMDDEGAKKFRDVAARANYLAHDRTDLQQACRCVFAHGEAFRRMLWDDETNRKISSRSTARCPTIPIQCGTVRHCHVCRQRFGWLSSGGMILLMSLAGDEDLKPTAKVYTDSTAAPGICHRSGHAGRTRHTQVSKKLSTRKSSNSTRFPPSSTCLTY